MPDMDIPGVVIPGIGASDALPVLGLGSGCPAGGAGVSMPGIARGAGAVLGGISMSGMADGAGGVGAPLGDMSIPDMDRGVEPAAGAIISMPRIGEGGRADVVVARTGGRFAVRFWAGWAPLLRGCGLAPGFALAAALAGIFIPGIGMPPIFCAAAAAGSSAATATAASHLFLII